MKNYNISMFSEERQNQIFAQNGKMNLNKIDHETNSMMTNQVSTSLQYSLSKIDSMQNAIKKDKNDRATVD